MLAVAAAMSWAAGTVYLKWAKLEGDPMAITIWQLVFGLVVIAVCVPVFEGALHLNAGAWSLFGLIYSRHHRIGPLLLPVVRHRAAAAGVDRRARHPRLAGHRRHHRDDRAGRAADLDDAIGFAFMLSASAIVVLRPEGATEVGR